MGSNPTLSAIFLYWKYTPLRDNNLLMSNSGAGLSEQALKAGKKKIYTLVKAKGLSKSALKRFTRQLDSALKKTAEPQTALLSLERLLSEAQLNPEWLTEKNRLEKLLLLFGYSEALTQLALKEPEHLFQALELSEKEKLAEKDFTSALAQELDSAGGYPELAEKIRRFKNLQYLRLGILNLWEQDRLEQEMKELSGLAQACLELGGKKLLQLSKEKKLPGIKPDFTPEGFCVIALGKLGSYELNFSSDLDLIYLCPDLGKEEKTCLEQYFLFAQRYTTLFSEAGEQGIAFRIDLRLRPGGEGGPLVNQLGQALDYYFTQGRSWERLALLRARPIAGKKALGENFLQQLEGFIFRRSYDFSGLEELKEIKAQIEQEAKASSDYSRLAGFDLKLGRGGIRELEFFVLILQQIYAGRYPQLKVKGIIPALEALNQLGLVAEQETEKLSQAWNFLRRLEHRIQLRQLRQEHRIPRTEPGQKILARSFGCYDPEAQKDFFARIKKTLEEVEEIFSGLFGTTEPQSRYLALANPEQDPEELEEEFSELGFSEPALAVERWIRLSRILYRDTRSKKIARSFLGIILEEIVKSAEPDLSLLQLERFITNLRARFSYISLLKDFPASRQLLIDLFSQSEFLGNIFITYPALLDELLTPGITTEPTPVEREAELERRVLQARDYEEKLRELVRFQKQELVRIGMKELSGKLDIRQLEEELSLLAELILEQAYKISWEEVSKKYGIPAPDQKGERAGMLILALGKLGGKEMSWGSDLDLIFIFQGSGRTQGKEPVEVREFFIRLAQKIISTLQSPTPEGYLYKIDTRLRPSGRFGPLVVSLEGFFAYHRDSAQVWEKQALIRARSLIDGAGIRRQVEEQITRTIFSHNHPQELKSEMSRLLLKTQTELAKESKNQYDIKFGYGGELELEYIIQFFQLAFGRAHPSLRVKNTREALKAISELGLVEKEEGEILKRALYFYRLLLSRLRIYQDRAEEKITLEPEFLDRLAKKLRMPEIENGARLREKLEETREKVHKIFLKYLGGQ